MQFDPSVNMSLAGDDVLYASRLKPLQGNLTIEPDRCQRDLPGPAEMASRLAQHVAVRDRAVARRIGNVERLARLALGTRRDIGMEVDANRVLARLQYCRNIRPVAAEAVVGRKNRDIVDEDDRDGVEIGDVEI